MSYMDKYLDCEKLKRIVMDKKSLMKLSPKDFEEYRLKLFNTNINILDKAIQKAKHGRKANKMEGLYLSNVDKNTTEI